MTALSRKAEALGILARLQGLQKTRSEVEKISASGMWDRQREVKKVWEKRELFIMQIEENGETPTQRRPNMD